MDELVGKFYEISPFRYGFSTLHFDAMYSIIRDNNIASQKVAIRNGMIPIDYVVKHYRGEEMPHKVYRINAFFRITKRYNEIYWFSSVYPVKFGTYRLNRFLFIQRKQLGNVQFP